MNKLIEEIHKEIEELLTKNHLLIKDRKRLGVLIIKLIEENQKEFAEKLKEVGVINLKNLTPREQKVLELRFLSFKTLKETGEHLGATRERVRQIEAKAIERLRIEKQK